MEELRCVDNKNWIWIIVAVVLLSGSFGLTDSCGTGIGSSGNFLSGVKGGSNSWIWILVLVFLFNGGF